MLNQTGNNTSNFEYDVAYALIKYSFPLIIIAGTVGNTLSFLVLLSKKLRKQSVYLFLACLAISDTLVLYFSALKTWLRVITEYEILHQSYLSCKLITFILHASFHLSSWFVVLVNLDRFYAIWWPIRAVFVFSPKRAKIVLVATTLSACIYSSHVFWTYTLKLDDKGRILTCVSSDKYQYFMMHIFPSLKLTTYCFLPFAFVLMMNIAIICKLVRRSNQVRRLTSQAHQSVNNKYKIVSLLLTLSFTWLILTSPYNIWSLTGYRGTEKSNKENTLLLKTILFTMMYINHALNFYIYCLTGRKFRGELMNFLKCQKPEKIRRSIRLSTVRAQKSLCTDLGDAESSKNLMRI